MVRSTRLAKKAELKALLNPIEESNLEQPQVSTLNPNILTTLLPNPSTIQPITTQTQTILGNETLINDLDISVVDPLKQLTMKSNTYDQPDLLPEEEYVPFKYALKLAFARVEAFKKRKPTPTLKSLKTAENLNRVKLVPTQRQRVGQGRKKLVGLGDRAKEGRGNTKRVYKS